MAQKKAITDKQKIRDLTKRFEKFEKKVIEQFETQQKINDGFVKLLKEE